MPIITTVGLDLAKKVFQVHGVDGEGKVVVARTPHLLASAFFRASWRFFAKCLATRNKCSCGSLVQHRQPSVGRTVAARRRLLVLTGPAAQPSLLPIVRW